MNFHVFDTKRDRAVQGRSQSEMGTLQSSIKSMRRAKELI